MESNSRRSYLKKRHLHLQLFHFKTLKITLQYYYFVAAKLDAF